MGKSMIKHIFAIIMIISFQSEKMKLNNLKILIYSIILNYNFYNY